MRKPILLTSIAFISATLAANAAIIVDNKFDSGTAADAGYYRFGTTNTTLAVESSVLNYNYATGASSRSGVIKSFASQTLVDTGHSITFSFDIPARTLGSLQNHAFRWAIGNLAETTGDLASSTPFASGTRQMYQFSASTGTATGFAQYVTGSTSPVHNANGTATAITGFTGPASVATSGASSVLLTVTRTETGYEFSQTAFGVSSAGTLTVGTDIFNTIAFSMNNAGDLGFSLDNISVVTAVPEPGTYALLAGLATLGLVLRRRLNR